MELVWIEGRREHWIRFGRPVCDTILDRRRRDLAFAPGAVFGFARWVGGRRATVVSRIDILIAPPPGSAFVTVPGVTPGGVSLLRLCGWSKVERVLTAIDAVERLDVDAADVAPDYWRHVHARLSVAETPRPYSLARHGAWRRRERLL